MGDEIVGKEIEYEDTPERGTIWNFDEPRESNGKWLVGSGGFGGN